MEHDARHVDPLSTSRRTFDTMLSENALRIADLQSRIEQSNAELRRLKNRAARAAARSAKNPRPPKRHKARAPNNPREHPRNRPPSKKVHKPHAPTSPKQSRPVRKVANASPTSVMFNAAASDPVGLFALQQGAQLPFLTECAVENVSPAAQSEWGVRLNTPNPSTYGEQGEGQLQVESPSSSCHQDFRLELFARSCAVSGRRRTLEESSAAAEFAALQVPIGAGVPVDDDTFTSQSTMTVENGFVGGPGAGEGDFAGACNQQDYYTFPSAHSSAHDPQERAPEECAYAPKPTNCDQPPTASFSTISSVDVFDALQGVPSAGNYSDSTVNTQASDVHPMDLDLKLAFGSDLIDCADTDKFGSVNPDKSADLHAAFDWNCCSDMAAVVPSDPADALLLESV